jgi:tRNA A-37 threonylcarbamoyl transferase component Bud32
MSHECKKLERLRLSDMPVPTIIFRTDDFFVMEDTGRDLRSMLKLGLFENPETMIENLFSLLGKLHRSGEYHGASQLRNFTFSDGKIHFIDFEENFSSDAPLETLQFRDLFLLMFSLAKDRYRPDYGKMLQLYIETSGNRHTLQSIHDLTRRLKPVEKIISFPPLLKILDKDTRAVHRLLQDLKKF